MGFFEPIGSPNHASVGSVCYNTFGVIAPYSLFGFFGSRLCPDIENADMIFVWGANPATDSPPFMFRRIIKAKKRGAKIIAIDHFMSDICKRADESFLVRSGTDGALLLGVINEIISRNIYDKDFVNTFCYGFEELKRYSASFNIERVSNITGLSKERILELVELITAYDKTSLITYTGLEYSNSGTQSIRALYSIWALMGRIDKKGTLLISSDKPARQYKFSDRILEKKKARAIGEEEYPLFHYLLGAAQFMKLPESVLEGKPYKIRGLLNIGSSIITSYPNSELFAKTLNELDFLCVIDRFKTEDTKYADVILPASTYFEMSSFFEYKGFLRMREAVIDPIGESRSDMKILHELALRMGYGDLFPKDEKELMERSFDAEIYEKLFENKKGIKIPQEDHIYRKYEMGLLRQDGDIGFPTKTGKVELKSSLFEEFRYPGLPEYIEPTEGPISSPELFKEYPLILNTGTRIQTTFRSQHLNIEGLLNYQRNSEALINIEDARNRGIKTGDKVEVKTVRDSVIFTANVTEDVPKGEVELNMGGGASFQSEGWKDSNTNMLTDNENVDKISGFPIYKALLCDVVLC